MIDSFSTLIISSHILLEQDFVPVEKVQSLFDKIIICMLIMPNVQFVWW